MLNQGQHLEMKEIEMEAFPMTDELEDNQASPMQQLQTHKAERMETDGSETLVVMKETEDAAEVMMDGTEVKVEVKVVNKKVTMETKGDPLEKEMTTELMKTSIFAMREVWKSVKQFS